MSLISSLPFCVKEFDNFSEVVAAYDTPYAEAQVLGSGTTYNSFKGSLFPLALTKAQAHALYWKVKQIELAYEVSTAGTDAIGFPETFAEVPSDFLGSSVRTAIHKRVCGGLSNLPYTSGFYTPPPADETTYDGTSISLFQARGYYNSEPAWVDIPRCVKVGDAYYPMFAWGDDAYGGGQASTFGIESTRVDGANTFTSTWVTGPTVTLDFPDSSTATFATWLLEVVKTGPSPGSTSSDLTVSNWPVILW
jgi:hypothetical protein